MPFRIGLMSFQLLTDGNSDASSDELRKILYKKSAALRIGCGPIIYLVILHLSSFYTNIEQIGILHYPYRIEPQHGLNLYQK